MVPPLLSPKPPPLHSACFRGGVQPCSSPQGACLLGSAAPEGLPGALPSLPGPLEKGVSP